MGKTTIRIEITSETTVSTTRMGKMRIDNKISATQIIETTSSLSRETTIKEF
jgi:hypothetical protein